MGAEEVARAGAEAVPASRRALPSLAPHIAQAALRRDPAALSHQVTLSRPAQEGLEAVARDETTSHEFCLGFVAVREVLKVYATR